MSVKSRAIVTIALGQDPAYWYGLQSIKAYAARVGAELRVVDAPQLSDPRLTDSRHIAWLQKIWVIQQVQAFDSVLYLDADVIVTPHAPDLFALMDSADAVLAAYDETHCDRLRYFKTIPDEATVFPTWRYFNAGVLFVTAQTGLCHVVNQEEVVQWMLNDVPCPEQTYVSYLINQHQLACYTLPREFNFMEESSADFNRSVRLAHSFIHYAGYSFRVNKRQKRCHVMRADYLYLYKKSVWHYALLTCIYWFRDKTKGLNWSLSKKLAHLRMRRQRV